MKLSVIIVTYEMDREAPRTLRSTLPPLQADVADIEYEICILDNGSPSGPPCFDNIDLANVTLREVHVPPDLALPSPVSVINGFVAESVDSDYVMICIDGARILSKRAISRSLRSVSRIPGSVAFLQNRHLGDVVQSRAVRDGYCQEAEDELLASIDWEADLDQLYKVSVLGGTHDKARPILQDESNALTMARATWDAIDGYNPNFNRPGGGLCNLDLFSRILERPDGVAVLIAGEATFHQFHGGAATSSKGYFRESLDEYFQATGKRYQRPKKSFLIDFDTEPSRLMASGIQL